MRRLLPALAVVALAAAPASASLGAKTRTYRAQYVLPGGVAGLLTGGSSVQGRQLGAVTVDTKRTEYAVDVTLTDDTGLPSGAELMQAVSGELKELATVCGRTAAPVRLLKPGAPVEIYLSAGRCGTGASAPVKGTVVAKLYTRK